MAGNRGLYPGEATEDVSLADVKEGDTLLITERGTVSSIEQDHVVVAIDGRLRRFWSPMFTRVVLAPFSGRV